MVATISTFYRNGYNGASVTDGTVATGGDGTVPGGNTGLLSIAAISGSSLTWKDDTRFGGTKVIRISNAAGQGASGRAAMFSSTYTPGAAFDFECPAFADTSGTPMTLLTLRNGAGSIQVRLTNTGLIDLLSGASGSQTSAAVPKKPDGTTTMSPLVVGSLYRLEVWATGSSSTVNTATITAAVFAYGADKATWLGKTTATGSAVGTNAYTASDSGLLQYATTRAFNVANLRTNDGATDFMGPNVTTNQPPQLTLPANRSVAVGAVVNTTATATDSDGTITSYAWSIVAPSSDGATLTNATSATCTFTAGSAGSLYVLQCVVTDSGGAQTPGTTEVRVETTGDAFPLTNTPATGYVRTGSTTDGAALADGDNTTYLETPSALSATVQRARVRVQPMATRSGVSVTVPLRMNGHATATANITLQQGTTDKGSLGSVAVTDANSYQSDGSTIKWTDYTLTLTTSQVSSITDWGNLFVAVDFTS